LNDETTLADYDITNKSILWAAYGTHDALPMFYDIFVTVFIGLELFVKIANQIY
jgi:hypothetical protein